MNPQTMHTNTLKDQLGHFGRAIALLLNRAMMYQKDHPLIKESVDNIYKIADPIFYEIPSLVFILNRGQFYVDEEPLDPRINVSRTAELFKSVGIQSVSFEKGLAIHELTAFLELFSKLTRTSDIEELKQSLSNKGVFNIKVNHVTYQKVTEDDQVVSRDALKQVTPLMDIDDQQSRKKFLDALLESVLSEELSKTLSINNLMTNPAALTQHMIQADLAGARQLAASGTPDQGDIPPGTEDGQTPGNVGPGVGSGDGPGEGAGLGPGFGPGVGPSAGPGMGTGDGQGEGAAVSDSIGPPTGASGAGNGSHADAADTMGFEGDTLVLESGKGFYGEGTPGTADPAHPVPEAMNPSPQAAATAGDVAGSVPTPPAPGTVPSAGGTVPDGDAEASQEGAGALLVHQLKIMQQEVERHLEGEGEVDLSELAFAVFDMKKQLIESIQTQKALGVAYANEAAIVENANMLSDKVVVELVREEYAKGKISIQRLAMIMRRLIPDAEDLRRLMPKIKVALLASGMSLDDYIKLVSELQTELQNEELSRILQESSESIGIDGDELIAEFKRNPTQAAELIYLASEIQASAGDKGTLTGILVDYIEKLGGEMAREEADQAPEGGEDHLQNVITEIESGLLRQLGQLNVDVDVLTRMEARINERMETILDKMRVEWLQERTAAEQKGAYRQLTVLQTLENNVSDDSEMKKILEVVRRKVDEGDIEENDFDQIYDEIAIQKKRARRRASDKQLTAEVLQADELIYLLEKEIAKAKRYLITFSVLAFSFVTAKPKVKTAKNVLSHEAILEACLEELTEAFREVDFIGQIGKNKLLVILPMTGKAGARTALERVLKELHAEPILVRNVPVQLRVAGITETYDQDQVSDARTFAKRLSNQLMDMVTRVKNIQVLV